MPGFDEERSAMGVNAYVHKQVILWMQRRRPGDYNTAHNANISTLADTVRYEHGRKTNSGYFVMYRNVQY